MGEHLNILVYGTPIYKSILEKIQSQDLKDLLNWKVTEMKDIKSDEDASNEIMNIIDTNYRNGAEINVILLFSDKLEVAKLLPEKLEDSSLSNKHYPYLILALEKDVELDEDRINKSINKGISIRKAIYTENNHNNVIKELAKAYAYTNDLGDYFQVPKNVVSLNSLKTPDGKICLLDKRMQMREKECINFIFISKSCAEKDVLINKMIGEQKVNESKTKNIQKYYHNNYPLCLINSPDLEREDDYERIKEYFSHNLAIDAVFFVINSKSRTFNDEELDLLKNIRDIGIPIFFPITKCRYKKEALGFKSTIEKELQQNFGLHCDDLLDHIQILNLSDPESKSLPIGYGLEELKDIFIKYFDNLKQNLKEKEQTLDDNTKLLSSVIYCFFYILLFSRSFVAYLINSVIEYFIISVVFTSVAVGAVIYSVKNKIPPKAGRYVQFISIPVLSELCNYLLSHFFVPNPYFYIGAGVVSDISGWLGLRLLLGNYQNGNQRRWSSTEERINIIHELHQLKENKDSKKKNDEILELKKINTAEFV